MGAEALEPQPGEPAGDGPRRDARDIGLPEIPGYRIEETLGRGSTGVVYRATQLAVEREVALKVLHPDLAGRPKAVRRLQREARTTARLTHPNIVSAIDLGRTAGGLWWYAMELVRGQSLAERLRSEGRIGEREALRLFTPLVDALDHAFRAGVVHRDIKPANILIDENGRARLVDLGLAFREDDPLITSPGGTLGTPHYVSPEQARKPESADARSDIWSLGATLYHAVCGRPPFAGTSVAEILSGVLYGRVHDPLELEPKLSRNLALVLRKCLTRDPAGRYQSPRELLEDLEHLREREPVGVRAGTLDPLARTGGVRWGWVVAASALLVVLSAGAGLLWWHGVSPDDSAVDAASGWAELESVAARVGGPERELFALRSELEALRPPPQRWAERFEEVEEQLLARYREASAEWIRRIGAEIAGAVGRRRFDEALALVSRESLESRARADLAPDPAQWAELNERLDPQQMRRGIEELAQEHAAEIVRRSREHFSDALAAAVANDVAAGQWNAALERLRRPVAEHLTEARLSLAGLPGSDVAAIQARLREDLDRRQVELEDGWRRLDRELVAWLAEESGRIARRLEAREQTGSAAADLADGFARARDAQGVAPGQGLTGVAVEAPAALARHIDELSALEGRLLEQDALTWLARDRQDAQRFLSDRRFDLARALWEANVRRAWLAPVAEEMELELLEATLLEGLLRSAAEGVSARDGSTMSLNVRSIQYVGRLEAGADPLRQPFRLVPEQGAVQLLTLRPSEDPAARGAWLLPVHDIELFAGLPSDPERSSSARERLARALLRRALGDTAGALLCLPIPAGEEAPVDALARRLESELSVRQESEARDRDEREAQARAQLNLLMRDARQGGQGEEFARRITEFLGEFGDLAFVRERSDELARLRDGATALAQQPQQLDPAAALRPTRVLREGRALRLSFDLGVEAAGAWSRGNWRTQADGWIAAGSSDFAGLRADGGWPQLALAPAVDLDAALTARFRFEQPFDSGPPRLLVLSVAGVHVLLRGASGTESARVHVGSGAPEDLAALLVDLEERGRGRVCPGLLRGESYTLEVSISQSRGRAAVWLEGRLEPGAPPARVELISADFARPKGKRATDAVVLRSLEPVRFLTVELEL